MSGRLKNLAVTEPWARVHAVITSIITILFMSIFQGSGVERTELACAFGFRLFASTTATKVFRNCFATSLNTSFHRARKILHETLDHRTCDI